MCVLGVWFVSPLHILSHRRRLWTRAHFPPRTPQERLLYLIFWLLWVTSAMLFGLLDHGVFGLREIILLGILALIIAVQWACYFHTLAVQGIVDAVRKCCSCQSGMYFFPAAAFHLCDPFHSNVLQFAKLVPMLADVSVADTSAAKWTTHELDAPAAASQRQDKLATIVELQESPSLPDDLDSTAP